MSRRDAVLAVSKLRRLLELKEKTVVGKLILK
jgi:hypothetical protein